MSAREATVLTHRRPHQVADALHELRRVAVEQGVTLRFDPEETRKHGIELGQGVLTDAPISHEVELCFALGGDGTVLSALRTYACTGVPVFAVNFGEIGFLATVDPDACATEFARAFAGDFEVMELPTLSLSADGREWVAVNDVSFQRKQGLRVADLAYEIGSDEVGRVRCDGLVVATPAGSTGYNLANGGPVMAWGVEGFVVSFIAPHSLTARAVVVAPDDVLAVHNRSEEEPADVTVDGRPTCELPAGAALQVRFADAQTRLAQLPGATFYHRLREKFGRLAT